MKYSGFSLVKYDEGLYHFFKVSSCQFLIHATIFWQIIVKITSSGLFTDYYVRPVELVVTGSI